MGVQTCRLPGLKRLPLKPIWVWYHKIGLLIFFSLILIDPFFTSFAGTQHRISLAPSTWAGRVPRNGLYHPNFMFLGDMIIFWDYICLCFWKSSFKHLDKYSGWPASEWHSIILGPQCIHAICSAHPQWIQFERAEEFLHVIQTSYYRRHLVWRWCHWKRYCPMR